MKFPTHSSDSLNNPSSSFNARMMPFDIVDGGRFISDEENLPDTCIPGVLELFASFIKIKSGHSYTDFDPPEAPPPNCMHKTMGAEGFSYTGFSSESFRRRFLRKNIPKAKSGRAVDVELYTKCTEKQRFEDISVLL